MADILAMLAARGAGQSVQAAQQAAAGNAAQAVAADAISQGALHPEAVGTSLRIGPIDTGVNLPPDVSNFAAGVGRGLTRLGQGVGQALGIGAAPSAAQIGAQNDRDVPLMATKAGFVGNLAGTAAPAGASMLVPGANTVTGSALLGAGLGAAEPVATDGSRIANTALGALGGAGSAYLMGGAANALASRYGQQLADALRANAAAAPKLRALEAGQDLGLVVPPSAVNRGSVVSQLAESLAGKVKTAQAASAINQGRIAEALKADVGLAPTDELTRDSLDGVIQNAYQTGYAPLKSIPAINWTPEFVSRIGALKRSAVEGAVPSPAQGEIDDLAQKLVDRPKWSGNQLLSDVQRLRQGASDGYAAYAKTGQKGARELADFQRGSANALEDLAEQNMAAQGLPQSAMDSYRNARTLIAKANDIERNLTPAEEVNAKALGAALAKGAPYTGNLEKAAQFGQHFYKFAQPPSQIGAQVALSPGNYAVSELGGAAGASLGAALGGSPGAVIGALGGGGVPFAAPALARRLVLSGPWQRQFAQLPIQGASRSQLLSYLLRNAAPIAAAAPAAAISSQ